MEKQIITINFENIKNAMDVMQSIDKAFGFNEAENINWNAIYDDLRSLNTQSPVVFRDMPKAVHVTLKNPYKVKENSQEDYDTMIEVMAEATDKKQRSDGIDFTFEISNDYEQ